MKPLKLLTVILFLAAHCSIQAASLDEDDQPTDQTGAAATPRQQDLHGAVTSPDISDNISMPRFAQLNENCKKEIWLRCSDQGDDYRPFTIRMLLEGGVTSDWLRKKGVLVQCNYDTNGDQIEVFYSAPAEWKKVTRWVPKNPKKKTGDLKREGTEIKWVFGPPDAIPVNPFDRSKFLAKEAFGDKAKSLNVFNRTSAILESANLKSAKTKGFCQTVIEKYMSFRYS